MAVFSWNSDIHAGYAQKSTRLGPKTREIATYAAIGLFAMAVAIPAALATSGNANAGLFSECFAASCEQNQALAVLKK